MKTYTSGTILVVALMISSAFGMEDTNNLHTNNKKYVPTIYIGDQTYFLYIGISKKREAIEKTLGRKFLLSEPFVIVRYRNCPINYIEQPYPDYMPYSMLRNLKENDPVAFTIGDEKTTFFVKQLPTDNILFQDKIAQGYEKFKQKASFLKEGEESLINGGIIRPVVDGHGITLFVHGSKFFARRSSH
jgi:hypothetical protein